MKEPLVSIITPCYNGEKYLDRFFHSILNQTYSNLELVFINDGSTDRTEELVQSYQAALEERGIHFIYKYQENNGQASALNRGLKLFAGEYLIWMDSDDVLMPEFIQKKVSFLQEHTEYVYCYGKVIYVDENNPEKVINTYEKRKIDGRHTFFEDILFVNNVFFPGYMVKTAAIDTILPNREIYTGAGGQNAQLLLPLAWYFGEPGYVEESVYKYYVRGNSHSHSQNTSEKVIQQLYDYENILLSTLQTISQQGTTKYVDIVQKHYARLRFGNAVDTKQPDLIRKYYSELKQRGAATIHDFLLYMKYANRLVCNLFYLG